MVIGPASILRIAVGGPLSTDRPRRASGTMTDMVAPADNEWNEERPSAPFEVGAKGRAVIPVAVRRAAGVAEGQTMVAQADAPGRIVLETPEAIQARVWAGAPGQEGEDAADDLRALRDEDNRLAEAAAGRRARGTSGREAEADDLGERLLKDLGL